MIYIIYFFVYIDIGNILLPEIVQCRHRYAQMVSLFFVVNPTRYLLYTSYDLELLPRLDDFSPVWREIKNKLLFFMRFIFSHILSFVFEMYLNDRTYCLFLCFIKKLDGYSSTTKHAVLFNFVFGFHTMYMMKFHSRLNQHSNELYHWV